MTTNLKLFTNHNIFNNNGNNSNGYTASNVYELNASGNEKETACKELEKVLEEKEILLREVHHRVKNNLQLMTSLLNIQSASVNDNVTKLHLKTAQSRIKSLAIIHQLLYKSSDLTKIDAEEYLYSLASHTMAANIELREKINIKISAPNVYLSMETSVPFALLINELLLNSIRNYSRKGENGEIKISIEDNKDGSYCMIYSDTMFKKPFTVRNGHIINSESNLLQTLITQLEGSITLIPSKGITFKIEFSGSEYQTRLNFA
jgi:two-component sensor histidine kinase